MKATHPAYRELREANAIKDKGARTRPPNTENTVREAEWLMCGGPADGGVFIVYAWRDHANVWVDSDEGDDQIMFRYEPVPYIQDGRVYLLATVQGEPVALSDEELYDRIIEKKLAPEGLVH